MLPQEDFDTHTSVDTDIIKKTDAQLDPMPEEGGELPGKNPVKQVRRTNKGDLIPFYFQAVAMQDTLNNPREQNPFSRGL